MLRRMPNVIYVGHSSVCRRVVINEMPCLKKTYRRTRVARECFANEILARQLFADQPWIAPIVAQGHRWLAVPLYPQGTRLDRAAIDMDEDTRLEAARQAIMILFEIFTKGYAHRDFHAKNLFWVEGRLIATDFEVMILYPQDKRPEFHNCYDIGGHGLSSPLGTYRMCYSANDYFGVSLKSTLKIPLHKVLDMLSEDLDKQET